MSRQVLLVEGESDRGFLEEVCKALDLHTKVEVSPPKRVGGSHNTREGVFNHLKNVMLKQLDDATITRLAIVVDADSDVNGCGYSRTIQRVTRIVEPHGFTLKSDSLDGVIFKHNDGLADFGLWVMPNNLGEGMLEDFIKTCVKSEEHGLLAHATTVVGTLPQPPKFKQIHTSKAEVATWMAWQEKPGHGLYHAVEKELIDMNSALFRELCDWLTYIYISEDE